MIAAAFVMLALAGSGFAVRVIAGPSVADRVVALDGLLIVVVAALAVEAARTARAWFVDVAVVIGLLGFVATGVAARMIERRGA